MSVRKSSRFMRELAIGGFEDWGLEDWELIMKNGDRRQKMGDRALVTIQTGVIVFFASSRPGSCLLSLIQKAGKEIRPCLPAG